MTVDPTSRRRLRFSAALIGVIAIVGILWARMLGKWAFADFPHVMDEASYVLQAKTLAMGRLTLPAIEPRGAFNMWFVDDRNGVRFGIFPPGWPATLALGFRFGFEHWVNPCLHGAATVVTAMIAYRLGGIRAATITAAIFASSPQTLLLAGSAMSHPLIAACAAVVMLFVVRVTEGDAPSILLWLASGTALGVAAVARPLCAVVIGLAPASAMLVRAVKDNHRPNIRELACFALPILACLALLGAYNGALTGDALRFPVNRYFDEHLPPSDAGYFRYRPGCNTLGFGAGHGCDLTAPNGRHTVMNALSNVGDNMTEWMLLLGGGPSFAVAALYAFGRRRDTVTTILLGVVGANVAIYMLYWHGGTCFGARYYHAAVVPVLLLAGLGLTDIRRPTALTVTLVAWFAINLWSLTRAWPFISNRYWGTDDRYVRLAQRWEGAPALVMVGFGQNDPPIPTDGAGVAFLPRNELWSMEIMAQSALTANGPLLAGRVVFAKFHPALTGELQRTFPDRRLWLYIQGTDDEEDRLIPWSPELLAYDDPLYPVDNFSGYRVRLKSDPYR